MEEEANSEKFLRDAYADRLKDVTPETLPQFIEDVMSDPHVDDYGGICVAIGMIAAASAWAMNRHPGARGGITGFQAGAVMWEFIRHWDSSIVGECGARIQRFDDLLYPQYAEKFTTISRSTADLVQDRARVLLEEKSAGEVHPNVRAHWQVLAAGQPPFGIRVAD